MSIKSFILSFVSIFILFPVSVYADELRGRLPDGRAYRTDSDGTQLVDYIAELELTIDALNRRVNGLEYELEEKGKRITRLQRSGGRESSVQERDLFPRQDQVFSLEQSQQKTNEAEIQERLQPLEQELAQKRAETQKLARELESLRRANEENEARARASSDLNGWQQERQQLERQLASLREEAESREVEHARELARVRQERDRVATQVASQNEELRAYQASLRSKEEKNRVETEANKQLVAMQQRSGADSSLRRAPQEPPARASVSTAQQDNLAASRMRAVETLKGNISQDLSELSSLIANRDRLYQEYSRTDRTVGFRPGRAQSSNNRTVQTIRSEMARATSVHHLTPLSRDIAEIKKKMQDDIDFINRMMKMN